MAQDRSESLQPFINGIYSQNYRKELFRFFTEANQM